MERVNTSYSNPPLALYQSVELDVNLHAESIVSTTCLWLGFKEPVRKGFSFHLHCRQLTIDEVLVNGVKAIYTRKDPLKNLNPTKQKIYSGADFDSLYRSSLEISRDGELMITVPDLTNSKVEPPKAIPKKSPREVLDRYDRLLKAYNSLTAENLYEVNEEPQVPTEKTTQLLQITIKYHIQTVHGTNANEINLLSGVTFRKQPSFARKFEKNLSATNSSLEHLFDFKYPKEPAQCCYSSTFTNGSLRDIDGVRCWLPCIDALDQRLVYDISISCIRSYHVISVGKRILLKPEVKKTSKTPKNVHRFFTVNRIPASQLGFFIGKVESYRMPLHKTKGKIYVATGLADYLGAAALPIPAPSSKTSSSANPAASTTQEESAGTDVPVEKSLLKRPRGGSIDQSPSKEASNANNSSSNHHPPLKKTRYDRPNSPPPFHMPVDKTFMRPTSPTASHHSHHSSNGTAHQPNPAANSTNNGKEFSISVRRLYGDLVYHTVLGFDLAIRVIQKFVNHRYEYSEYSIIFIHELGHEFMAFDSFVFIDAKYLHLEDQIYLETTTNLLLVKSFLYSWFKSDIHLSAYENEFIIHGVIGYLLKFYLEEIYGEEEGHYYLQKHLDTVISLEHQGKGFPLSANFYSENYEVFSFSFGQYLLSKSMVLFQLIESKLKGRDSMRIALKQIIQAPTMFAPTLIRSTSPSMNSYTYDFSDKSPQESPMNQPHSSSPMNFSPSNRYPRGNNGGTGLSPDVSTPYSTGSVDSPLIDYDGTQGGGGAGVSGYLSPYKGRAGYQSPYSAYQSQQQQNNGAFTPYAGFSPYRAGENAHHGGYGGGYTGALGALTPFHAAGMLSVQSDNLNVSPSLSRQISISSDEVWEKDPNRYETSTLTAESFILLLRHVSEASTDLDETFLEKYVYNYGILNLRIYVKISERVEGKTRTIFVYTDQIGTKNPALLAATSTSSNALTTAPSSAFSFHQTGEFGKQFATKEHLAITLVEERDNNTTRTLLPFSGEKYEHKQQAHARPGRRSGRQSSALQAKQLEEMSEEDRAKYERAEKEKEARKSALQLVRDSEYGIRYILVDPELTYLMDIQNHSCDTLLVEQLNANYDELGPDIEKHKVYYQCQAIRSLARASVVGIVLPTASTSSSAVAGGGAGADGISSSIGATFGGNAKIPEKQAKIQIKALSDCILGITTTVNDNRQSSTACIFVRAEAAFALAKWQNEHSPENVFSEPHENLWPGMTALLECLFELFLDPTTKMPLPQNFQNESSVYLRNALLLAISSIRSQNGQTPWEIVQTLLLFMEDLDNLAEEVGGGGGNPEDSNGQSSSHHGHHHSHPVNSSGTGGGGEEDIEGDDPNDPTSGTTNNNKKKVMKAYDLTYYRAIILLCLSRIHFEKIDVSSESTHPMMSIIQFANSVITNAFTKARAVARIQYKYNDANYLPKLIYEGLDVAAAIHCLSEMDIQSAYLLSSNKGTGPSVSSYVKLLDLIAPTQAAIMTKTQFQSFFLPPGVSLMCLYDSTSKEYSNVNFKTQFHYFLCSPLIRVTAFESFVRLSFALHVAHYQKLKNDRFIPEGANNNSSNRNNNHHSSSNGPIPTQRLSSNGSTTSTATINEENSTSFVAVAVEAYQNIMEKDPSMWVKQQATQILLDAIFDKPSRIIYQAISLHCEWFTYGFSDCMGFTLTSLPEYSSLDMKKKISSLLDMKIPSNVTRLPNISLHSLQMMNPHKYALYMEGTPLKAALICLAKIITRTSAFNQVARSLLIQLWLYVFEEKIPPLLSNTPGNMISRSMDELFSMIPLEKERLIIRNPKELNLLFHEALRQPVGDVKYTQLKHYFDGPSAGQSSGMRSSGVAGRTSMGNLSTHSSLGGGGGGVGRTNSMGSMNLSISLSRSVDPFSVMNNSNNSRDRGLVPEFASPNKSDLKLVLK